MFHCTKATSDAEKGWRGCVYIQQVIWGDCLLCTYAQGSPSNKPRRGGGGKDRCPVEQLASGPCERPLAHRWQVDPSGVLPPLLWVWCV